MIRYAALKIKILQPSPTGYWKENKPERRKKPRVLRLVGCIYERMIDCKNDCNTAAIRYDTDNITFFPDSVLTPGQYRKYVIFDFFNYRKIICTAK